MVMKRVELCRIIRCDQSPECQMYLREVEGGRVFPIIIHQTEMAEIYRKVHGVQMRRPMTHDLFASLIEAAGLELVSVEVTELKNEVFYARMNFEGANGDTYSLDARPSDAVAVATGVASPVFAAEEILDQIGVVESGDLSGGSGS